MPEPLPVRLLDRWKFPLLIGGAELLHGYLMMVLIPHVHSDLLEKSIIASYGSYCLAFLWMAFQQYPGLRGRERWLFIAVSIILFGLYCLHILFFSVFAPLAAFPKFMFAVLTAIAMLRLLDMQLASGISLAKASAVLTVVLGIFYYRVAQIADPWQHEVRLFNLYYVVGCVFWQLLLVALMEAVYTHRVKWLMRATRTPDGSHPELDRNR